VTGRTAGSTTSRLWLPALVCAVLVPTMFWFGMRSDPPEVRAGAEPVLSGVMFAVPSVLLLLVHVLCALAAVMSGSRRGRRRALVAATAAAASMAVLVMWLVGLPAATDGSVARLAVTALLVLVLLGPVMPGWVAHRQENRQQRPGG
jgi:hypothetical protein